MGMGTKSRRFENAAPRELCWFMAIGLQNLSHGLKLRLAGRIASSPLRYPRLGRAGRGGAGRPSRRRFIPFQMELS